MSLINHTLRSPSSDEQIRKDKGGVTRHVLLVDDEPDIEIVVKKGLQRCGFAVTSYSSALKLIDNFKENVFTLLLSDIQMKEMSGYDLYRKLHKIDPKMKVCFFTGHNEYSEEFRTFFPEMDEKCFVNKPIPVTHLADRLTSIMDS